MKTLLLLACLAPTFLLAVAKNVIFMIPDGTGHASLTVARQLKGAPLALDHLINGTMQTRSADNSVTDSAAAATAMACGERTYNGAIGVDLKKVPLLTMGEWFHNQGKAVGIVTTDAITGATPAGFSAHANHRSEAGIILEQQLVSGFEVFLGGGRKDLTPAREKLLAERGYTQVRTAGELAQVKNGKIFGLFSDGIMTAKVERRKENNCAEPTLLEMTTKALNLLSQNPNGFFLMIEGAQVDKGNHENDLPWATYEMTEFDDTVALVEAWMKDHPDTLLFVTPDHETGGLTLLNEPTEGARAAALKTAYAKKSGSYKDYFVNYSSTWHTGVDVFRACSDITVRPARNDQIASVIAEMQTQRLEEIPADQTSGLRQQIDAIYIPATKKWYRSAVK